MNRKKQKSKSRFYLQPQLIQSVGKQVRFAFSGKMLAVVSAVFFFLSLQSCNSDYSPKPVGYFQIELKEASYQLFSDYPQFEFERSTETLVEEIKNDSVEGEWLNLTYPSFNARIYCNYIPVNQNLDELLEDSKHFVSLHIQRAETIEEYEFENPEQNVFGIVYKLKGKNPSPTQFILTDSIASFFRGALYFDSAVNQDSIAPVLEHINTDIQVLIESFRWKR